MSNDSLVSIIVPVYNVRRYLAEALESVLGQSYNRLEIIIIDDGSTDGSGEICDEYAKKDARVVVFHQENMGLSVARNVGISHAVGDYLMFLDSDDWLELDAVNNLVQVGILTNADIVCCGHYSDELYRTKNPNKGQFTVYCSEDALDALFLPYERGMIGTSAWGKIYKAEIFEGVRYPDGRVYEDISTTWRLVECAQSIACIPNPLIHYRARRGSIARGHSAENLIDYWIAYKECYDTLAHLSDALHKTLTEKCISAIGRTLCWWITVSKPDRNAYSGSLDGMILFARENIREVLTGDYAFWTKAFCLAGRWMNPIVWTAFYIANAPRDTLRSMLLYD